MKSQSLASQNTEPCIAVLKTIFLLLPLQEYGVFFRFAGS